MVDAQLALKAVFGDHLLGYLGDGGVADECVDLRGLCQQHCGRFTNGAQVGEVHANEADFCLFAVFIFELGDGGGGLALIAVQHDHACPAGQKGPRRFIAGAGIGTGNDIGLVGDVADAVRCPALGG